MNLFSFWLWILGIVNSDYTEDYIQKLANDEKINVDENIVKIDFSSKEDAELFAEKLKEFVSN